MASETAHDKHLHLTVITPARAVLSTDALQIVAPAFDGEVGLLPGHADMLALLGTGELRVNGVDGKQRHIALRGGFLQVSHNKVTILTPESAAAEEIKPEQLASELERLNALPHVKLEDRDALEIQKKWLQVKEKVAAKK